MNHSPHVRREQAMGVIPPPPGTAPNFTDPPSVKHVLVATTISFTLLSLAFVLIRLYTISFLVKKSGIEDSMVILAWLLALGSSIAFNLETCYGQGLHLWDITLETFVKYGKVGPIGSTMCGFSVMFSKLSILSFYLRFCQYRRLRMVIYTIIGVVVIYSAVSSFSFLYACRPMAKYWDPRITRGSCIHKLAIPVFNGIMNVVTDFFILIIPVFIFWRVRICKRQRIGLVLIFMTGGFVVVVSIIRLKTSIDIMHEIDISWHGTFVITWWVVEMHVAIICTSLPNLKPFLRRHFPKVLGSSFRTSTDTNNAATPSRTVQQFHTGDVDEVPLSKVSSTGQNDGVQRNGSTSTVELIV